MIVSDAEALAGHKYNLTLADQLMRYAALDGMLPGVRATMLESAAALRTPIPVAVSRAEPLDFFSENVDAWGTLEWFNRLATAIRQQDAAVLAKDDAALEICRNVAASSAMRFVRDYEQQVRAALSLPAVAVSREEVARIIDPDAKWGEVLETGSDDNNQILLALTKADTIFLVGWVGGGK